jgi:integrase
LRSEDKLTPHTFRHFFTTQLRLAGCPLDIVAELRGDKRTLAQDVYYKIPQDYLREMYERFVPKIGVNTYKTLTLCEFEETHVHLENTERLKQEIF